MTNLQLEVISLANEGLTCADICRKLNRAVSTVSGILVKFKDQIKDRQYYYQNTINHEYFDIIDSDIKAYFLGFFIADGTISISKRCIGRMGFCIQNDDSYILEKLLNNINCPNKIYVRINLNGAKCRKPQAILRWTSQHMASTLINKYIPDINTTNIDEKQLFKVGITDGEREFLLCDLGASDRITQKQKRYHWEPL